MAKVNRFAVLFTIIAVLQFIVCTPEREGIDGAGGSEYHDLLSLFQEFREFQKPQVTMGIPDYTPAAMKAQWRGLKHLQDRLAMFDIGTWPVSQQVDYHIVRAEMNGLEDEIKMLRQ